MASGKSLELAQIKPQASPLCTCGAPWKTHLKKDGEVMQRYATEKHRPQTGTSFNRRTRRRMGIR